MAESHDPNHNLSTPPAQASNLAVISLVAGILTWLIIPLLGAVVAIITGHKAKTEILDSMGALTGCPPYPKG